MNSFDDAPIIQLVSAQRIYSIDIILGSWVL